MNKKKLPKKELARAADLVLIDLDKTLIDSNYKLTVSEGKFRKIVKKLNDRKILVGLCSDSAVPSLDQWAKRLGIKGPLIAERGAVVFDQESKTKKIVNSCETNWLLNFRSAFINEALRTFPKVTFVIGDAVNIVQNKKNFPGTTDQLLIINSLRIASFSIYTRRVSESSSSMKIDTNLLNKSSLLALKLLLSFGKCKKDLFWDKNPDYGILIIHSKTSTKSAGIRFVNQHLNLQKIIMIGDDESDYINLPNVSQFAVRNASVNYKKKCSFVSTKNFTEGVIESMEELLRGKY